MKKVTQKQAEKAASNYLDLEAKLIKLRAEYKAACNKVETKYSGNLKDLSSQMEVQASLVENYAVVNREAILDEGAKSVKIFGITIGWRKSPSKLLVQEGGTIDTVLKKMKKLLPAFIITKESIDKSGLLKKLDEVGSKITKVGLEVEVSEKFFIKT